MNRRTYWSTEDDTMSSLSIATPVTCIWWPFNVWIFSPLIRFQTNTKVSILPETSLPSGYSSVGGIHASGPTKLVCPSRILEEVYLRLSDGSSDQTLMVLSLDEVAILSSLHTQIPRTWKMLVNHEFPVSQSQLSFNLNSIKIQLNGFRNKEQSHSCRKIV